jgi:GINS complex subunit 1
VIKDINELSSKRAELVVQVNQAKKTDPDSILEYLPGVTIREASIKRSKRCVLAYLHHRFEFVRDVWWDMAGVVPDFLKSAMSPEELESLDEYGAAVRTYQEECGVSLLTDLQPPAELQTRVVVLQDCGDVMTHYGPVKLDKGARYVLRRSDAEVLIRQGLVEQVLQ